MTATIAPLRQRAAWKALEGHYAKIRDLHLRQLFAEDPQRGERLTTEALGIYFDYSKNRITDETLKLLLQLADESGLRSRIDAMFSGEKDQRQSEKRAVLHVALRALRKWANDRRRRCRRRPASARRPRQNGRFLQPDSQRHLEGAHRQTHSQHRERRHWRFGPRACHGVRSVTPLHPTRAKLPFRFEHRRHRFRRSHARPRRHRNPVHHFVKNLHDARDDDQRTRTARVSGRS